MKIFNDISNFGQIYPLFVYPIGIIFLIYFIVITLHTILNSKSKNFTYNNEFITNILSVIVSSFLFAFSLGYAVSFIKSLTTNNLLNNNLLIYISIWPFILFIFVLIFIIKLYNYYNSKKYIYEYDKIESLNNNKEIDDNDIEVI